MNKNKDKKIITIIFLKIITLTFCYFFKLTCFWTVTYVDDIDVPANDQNGQNIPHGVRF